MSESKSVQTVFLIGPIGEAGSDIREAADTLKSEIVLPALQDAFGPDGFILERADEIGVPGRISLQVLEKLVASDIVVVDLTNLNPNVMYELGVRQACLKPYILLRPAGQALPFDISDIRAIDFEFSLKAGKEAIRLLRGMLENADKAVSPTDELLFRPLSLGKSDRPEGANQRIQVQILDQLTTVREGVANILGGVAYLMGQEERQRADLAEHRQQELGMRLMETMAGSNPEAMFTLLQQFANSGQQEVDNLSLESVPTPANREQRRAAAKRNRKQ
jgi:hypothetical protein